MFKRLKLTNFRQHEALEVVFEQGVVALRGANEAGKTTLIEALSYAWFGSSGLRESLEKVVTWGCKETALRVELDFEVAGVLYAASRSKAGAEIVFANHRVTGQTETKKFVEGLLGVPADVVTKMMMANQAALRGTLEEGPTAAAALIETLANFDLIDRIVGLVTEHLPSGNASALEAQVKMLTQQALDAKPGEFVLDTAALDAARAAVDRAILDQAAVEAEWAPLKEQAAKVRADRAALQALQAEQVGLQRNVDQWQTETVALNPASSFSEEAVAALRQHVAAQATLDRAQAAWEALQALQAPEQVWDGSYETFEQALGAQQRELEVLQARRDKAWRAHQGALARRINDKVCAFCKKDLIDVPEVAQFNEQVGFEIQTAALAIADIDIEIAQVKADLAELANLGRIDRAFKAIYQANAAFITVTDAQVPAGYAWTGPVLTQGARPAYAAMLRDAEAEVARAARDQGKQAALQDLLAAAEARLVELAAGAGPLAYAPSSPIPSLEEDLRAKVDQLRNQRALLDRDVTSCYTAIEHAKASHAQAVAAHARIADQLALAQRQLDELALNNVLIKKLRAARPKVADELWSIVLSSVSHYFSAIRGVKSAVTRAEKGFQVDGHAVAGLSGSTLDALGLAIRVALTKTFLPNSRFMILDEPGAACDDQRESNMLGLIASSDFDQVILVTHSDLADAFANQIVSL